MNARFKLLLTEVFEELPISRQGLMLFGSAARGDMDDHSDIDLLVLRKGPAGTIRKGKFNLSYYSVPSLLKMAADGSMFVRHLIMDGVSIEDPSGFLGQILNAYRKPTNYSAFRSELRSLVPMFDVSELEFRKRGKSWLDAAFFCLRTDVYIRADEADILRFSLTELEKKTRWDELRLLRWAKRVDQSQHWSAFSEIVKTLESSLGLRAENKYATIEAYVTNNYDVHPLILSIALRILSDSDSQINYDILSPFTWISGQ